MADQPIRVIQISDLHLLADPNGDLLKVKTEESFQAVVDLVKSNLSRPVDLIILSGDLSQDGSAVAYKRIAEILQPLNVPVYCVPGNHDDVKVMNAVYPLGAISNHKHIVLKNWHIVLLNSQKPGAVEGYLDKSQLDYMQHCLQTYPEHHAIILFHHQPIPVGAHWLDNLGLTNAEQLWQLLANFPKTKAVLFGHVHQEFNKMINGIAVYSTPSTCIQFKCHQNHFGLENLPPGYRWMDLFSDGHIETAVERVSRYVGEFDKDAKGY